MSLCLQSISQLQALQRQPPERLSDEGMPTLSMRRSGNMRILIKLSCTRLQPVSPALYIIVVQVLYLLVDFVDGSVVCQL